MRFLLPLRPSALGCTRSRCRRSSSAVGASRATQAVHRTTPPASVALAADARRPLPHARLDVRARGAHRRRTPTSFSYRRSTDRAYLQWTIDAWTRRAYAPSAARSPRSTSAWPSPLPAQPRPARARRPRGSRYSRRLALRLERIYPGKVTRGLRERPRSERPRRRSGSGSSAARRPHSRSPCTPPGSPRCPAGSPTPSLHPPLRGRLEREHRQRLLRRAADGPRVPAPLRRRLPAPLGHGRQLARPGRSSQAAARAYASGRGFGPGRTPPGPAACSSAALERERRSRRSSASRRR